MEYFFSKTELTYKPQLRVRIRLLEKETETLLRFSITDEVSLVQQPVREGSWRATL